MSSEERVRVTIPRLAEAVRLHMQMREKFESVMEAAELSPEQVDRLLAWLREWRANASAREIARRREAAQRLEAEIRDLRALAGTGEQA